MPHLDFVALREPVTCTLPTDEPGRKRLVRQFRGLEMDKYKQASALHAEGEDIAALVLYDECCRYAVEGITDAELAAMSTEDKVRLLGAAHGKLELIEAALGNARGDGGASTPKANPSPSTPVSTPTIHAALPSGG